MIIVSPSADAQKFSQADFQQIVGLIEEGKLSEAESRLSKGLKQDPDSVTGLRLLGSVYRQQEKYLQAEDTLERAVRQSARQDAQAIYLLSEIKFILGKREEALRLASEVTALGANDAAALYTVGRLLQDNSAPKEAAATLERAHNLSPADVAITSELIVADLDAQRLPEADALLKAFLKSASFGDLMQAGARFGEAGQFAAARRAFEGATKLRPASYDAQFNLAFALYREGNVAAARAALDQIDPHTADAHADYHHLRGRVELALKDAPAAIAHYQKALALEPDNESLCVELGLLYFSHETFPRALEVLEPCASRLPESSSVLTALALDYLELGRSQDAIGSFRKVLWLKPESDAAREALAFLLQVSGQLAEAQQVLEDRMGDRNVDFYIYYLHALTLQRLDPQGNRPAILRSLELTVQRNPRFAQAYLERGRIRADQGQTEMALADYRKATVLDPGYAQPYYHLAQLYFKMGKNEDAKAAQHRFAALNQQQEEREQKNQIENRVFQSLQ